jgi:hypothetical protein
MWEAVRDGFGHVIEGLDALGEQPMAYLARSVFHSPLFTMGLIVWVYIFN